MPLLAQDCETVAPAPSWSNIAANHHPAMWTWFSSPAFLQAARATATMIAAPIAATNEPVRTVTVGPYPRT
jgi:hypothetical protein